MIGRETLTRYEFNGNLSSFLVPSAHNGFLTEKVRAVAAWTLDRSAIYGVKKAVEYREADKKRRCNTAANNGSCRTRWREWNEVKVGERVASASSPTYYTSVTRYAAASRDCHTYTGLLSAFLKMAGGWILWIDQGERTPLS